MSSNVVDMFFFFFKKYLILYFCWQIDGCLKWHIPRKRLQKIQLCTAPNPGSNNNIYWNFHAICIFSISVIFLSNGVFHGLNNHLRLSLIPQVGRLENAIGWYHSHPGYGCWLSGIDVSTQMLNQQFQEPFVAVVVRLWEY